MRSEPLILVVDDEPANVKLLEAYLLPQGYRVLTASNGNDALSLAARENVDLVLLDVMMPLLDGFEATRRLRADSSTQSIPVVLVTSLKDTSDRIKGIEAGCDDFISKPFDKSELFARIRSLLRIKAMRDELQENYLKLQELEKMKNSLTHMIVHDLNNPLAVIGLKVDLLKMHLTSALTPEQENDLSVITLAVKELMRMINNLLDLNKMEDGSMRLHYEIFAARDLILEACAEMRVIAQGEGKSVEAVIDRGIAGVSADKELFRRVLVNLIGNAIKFAPSNGVVMVRAEYDQGPQALRVTVHNRGDHIPPEYIDRVFDKFVQVEAQKAKRGKGLGLAFCKLAVEAHGGTIRAQSSPEQGTTFTFNIPVKNDAQQ